MKTRIEFANNECGERLAKATVKTDGGRAVSVFTQSFDEQPRNFWFSFHYTISEIFDDFPGKSVVIH